MTARRNEMLCSHFALAFWLISLELGPVQWRRRKNSGFTQRRANEEMRRRDGGGSPRESTEGEMWWSSLSKKWEMRKDLVARRLRIQNLKTPKTLLRWHCKLDRHLPNLTTDTFAHLFIIMRANGSLTMILESSVWEMKWVTRGKKQGEWEANVVKR